MTQPASREPRSGEDALIPKSVQTTIRIDEPGLHSIVVVFRDGLPVVYVDGKANQEQSHIAVFDKALSGEQVERLYSLSVDKDSAP